MCPRRPKEAAPFHQSKILVLDFFNCSCWNVWLLSDLTELFINICIQNLHPLSDASLPVLRLWDMEAMLFAAELVPLQALSTFTLSFFIFFSCTQKPFLERSDGFLLLGWSHLIHTDASVWISTSKPIKEQTACQYPPDEAWTVNRRPRWKIKTSGGIVDEPLWWRESSSPGASPVRSLSTNAHARGFQLSLIGRDHCSRRCNQARSAAPAVV